MGGSLGSLFLVDMIPKVFVIVDGLDEIAGVQYPLLQNQSFLYLDRGDHLGLLLPGETILVSLPSLQEVLVLNSLLYNQSHVPYGPVTFPFSAQIRVL